MNHCSTPEVYKVNGVQQLGNKEVLLVDGTGSENVVNAAEIAPKNTCKKPKKKNMNEEAANYCSSMLEIQEKLAKERMKVYKLQQDLLKEKLRRLKAEPIGEGKGDRRSESSDDTSVGDGDGFDL